MAGVWALSEARNTRSVLSGRDRRYISGNFRGFGDRLQILFGTLSRQGLNAESLTRYRGGVAELLGFNREDVLHDARPVTKFDMASEESICRFLEASNQLVNDWRHTQLDPL